MGNARIQLFIGGMTCPACEKRVAEAARKTPGVLSAEVSLEKGTAAVEFDDEATDRARIVEAIERAGYSAGGKKPGGTAVALGIGALLAAAYLAADSAGAFASVPAIAGSMGYLALFAIGVLTSVHCAAMCGGIALSQSVGCAAGSGSPDRNGRGALNGGLLYNAGRVLSYTAIGAAAGAFGAAFSFSPAAKGVIAGAAGLFMVLFGLRMLGVLRFPAHAAGPVGRRLGAAAARLRAAAGSKGPFVVGVLNGFMPCGPLQSMQFYALGAGSAAAGALSLFAFSIGTVPLLLLFGATAAMLPRRFLPALVKTSAVLVVFLGLMTGARAAALAGIAVPSPFRRGVAASSGAQGSGGIAKTVVANGVQRISTRFGAASYVPFIAQAGVPLEWTITVGADDLNGCNNPVTVPAYGITKKLVPGDNVIRFTPEKTGRIAYSCWMGMITSSITVVDDVAASAPDSAALADLIGPEGTAGGSGCCGSGAGRPGAGNAETAAIGMPKIENGIQTITVRVDGSGYTPSTIVLQRGMKAVIKFDPAALDSCNNPILFPEYNGALDLAKGQTETPPLAISGDFTFRCWMGMLNGYVKVVDDLATADLDAIRSEAGSRPTAGSACCGSADAQK